MENNPITRVFPDFQDEVMKIDPRLTIEVNENRKDIANIKLDGTDICPIPRFEIRDFHDAGYTSELPNGTRAPHRSKEEAINMIKQKLDFIKIPENADMFHGRNV